MLVRLLNGTRVFPRRKARGVARPGQWFPRGAERYYFEWGGLFLWVQYQPFRGMFTLAVCRRVEGATMDVVTYPSLWSRAMKKFTVGTGDGSALPPLSSESKLLHKLPRFRAFLTDTAYEDGSPRAPGRFWFDSDGVGFTITLMEPSAYARVRLRAVTIDDVFMLCEVHLGAESPPWEVDQYARDRAAGKKKK